LRTLPWWFNDVEPPCGALPGNTEHRTKSPRILQGVRDILQKAKSTSAYPSASLITKRTENSGK
jgi:hypothetical protein